MSMPKKFTEDQVEFMVDLYVEEAWSVAQIAQEMNCSPLTVRNYLTAKGITFRKPGTAPRYDLRMFTEEEVKEIARLYVEERYTVADLAYVHSCHKSTIVHALDRGGVSQRRGMRRDLSGEEMSTVRELAEKGVSQAAIGLKIGVSQVLISRVMREAGIKTRYRHSGDMHGAWKGGTYISSEGYIMQYMSQEHPFYKEMGRRGYAQQHRLVMAESLGRPLTSDETVHHINGDRQDNRLENLQLRHGRHGKGSIHRCANCGSYNVVTEAIAT